MTRVTFFRIKIYDPSELSLVRILKSPAGSVSIQDSARLGQENWEIARPSVHGDIDTVRGILESTIIDLKYNCVNSEKIRHLIEEQITQLDSYLYPDFYTNERSHNERNYIEICLSDATGKSSLEVQSRGIRYYTDFPSKAGANPCEFKISTSLENSDENARACLYYQMQCNAKSNGTIHVDKDNGDKDMDLVVIPPLGDRIERSCILPSAMVIGEQRLKSLDKNDMNALCEYLKIAQNIIVLCGAGISTSAGIPDFRSKGGLFEKMKEDKDFIVETKKLENDPSFEITTLRPEMIFSVQYFRKNPWLFYKRLKEIWVTSKYHPEESKYKPTSTHRFLKILENKNKLLRVYTQNIDGLEYKVGCSDQKILQVHGGFRTCHGIDTGRIVPNHILEKAIFGPKKQDSEDNNDHNKDNNNDNKDNKDDKDNKDNKDNKAEDKDILQEDKDILEEDKDISDFVVFKNRIEEMNDMYGEKIKPSITMYGEALPNEYGELSDEDVKKCDLLIVLGTSLKVAPVNNLVSRVSKDCPRVLINRDMVGIERREFCDEYSSYSSESEEDENNESNGGKSPSGGLKFSDYLDGGFRFKENLAQQDKHLAYRDIFFEGSCDTYSEAIMEQMGWSY